LLPPPADFPAFDRLSSQGLGEVVVRLNLAIALWAGAPSDWAFAVRATITTEGMSNSTAGAVSTPGLAAGSLATSMRR
jgi:hypothetical protein